MTDLPLNIPYLLKKYYPQAQYVLNGRGYDDINWVDTAYDKPTITELESLFHADLAHSKSIEARAEARVHGYRRSEESIKREVEEGAAAKVEAIKAEEELKRKELTDAILERERLAQLSITEKQANLVWEEVTKEAREQQEIARKRLAETDWYIIRKIETGLEVPEDILQQRECCRAVIQKGELVYANWLELRRREYPSKIELVEALKKGGLDALNAAKKIKEINDKYKKPSY